MEKKKILIAESSPELIGELRDRLEYGYSLEVCRSGLSVMELLEGFRPDVLVMDLALPDLDGISLLRRIAILTVRPKILLTTCFMSSYVETAIAGLGVDLVMLKPFKAEVLTERIEELIWEDEPQLQLISGSGISSMLMDLNIPANRRGFCYLEQSIRLYVEQPGRALTKTIYPEVARDHFTQSQAVERAIRQVLHESWENRDDRVWRMYFSTGREGVIPRPTNGEFISRLAERYKQCQQRRA